MKRFFAGKSTRLMLAASLAGLSALAGCEAIFGKGAEDKTPEQWQAIARADLDAVHGAIIAAHPGYIDDANPEPRTWAGQGYLEAQALIPRVESYDTMMSAVRYYVAGFRDGHFVYSDNVRSLNYRERVTGWRVDRQGDGAVVSAVMPGWDTPLPPKGARLLDCDGRTPDAIVAADVAPYVDARALPEVRDGLIPELSSPHLAGLELKHCTFRRPDGTSLVLDVGYRRIPTKEVWDTLRNVRLPVPDHRNRYDFQDGVLWIRAANFNLDQDQARELDAMLGKLVSLGGVRRIVFDTRGNAGGDSAVGQQILDAATGGLDFDTNGLERRPRVYAQWRVSDVAIAGVDRYIGMMTERYGASDARTRELASLRKKLHDARRDGRAWVDTAGSARLTNTEIAARDGRLRRFDGAVAVITDGNCASACLDFVDLVRLIPGAVQLGRTTASDTLYLEQAPVTLPSGNLLFMPMKVWRNRVRGDGEVLVPHILLNVDMHDDDAVRSAALAAFDQLPARP